MSRQFFAELLNWIETDGTAVANTTTETILVPNITIPGNYLQGGRVLRLTAVGRLSSTATPTVRFRLRLGGVGGTVIWDSGTITLNNGTAALWKIEVLIQVRANGASGTVFAVGDVVIGSAAAPTVASATGAPAHGVFGSAGDDTPAAVTVDLTASQDLALTAQWSAAAAGNTAQCHVELLESLN